MVKVLFTSYKCSRQNKIVKSILKEWEDLNPTWKIKYFSDKMIDNFFLKTEYYETFKLLRTGVAKADFFRISYINKYGGYWFDIDLQPIKLKINTDNNIHLFDVGFGNISYMLIGGKPNQKLLSEVIDKVNENILNNINYKKTHILNITGPKIIQDIIFKKLNIKNNRLKKKNVFPASYKTKIYLNNTNYEFEYTKINIKTHKTNKYKQLLRNYNQYDHCRYNYI